MYIMKELKVFFKEMFTLVKCRSLNRSSVKCLIFYLFSSLLGKLIKDYESREEYYEFLSEYYAEDGKF